MRQRQTDTGTETGLRTHTHTHAHTRTHIHAHAHSHTRTHSLTLSVLLCCFSGQQGGQQVIPFRGDEHDYRHLRVTGDLGQVQFLPYQLLDKESITRAVQHSNVVINLVGQDTDSRHFSLEDANITGATNIAQAAQEAGVSRLIHVSALGADKNSASRFLQSKALGEEAVRAAFPTATIMRPSHIFGYEDRFLNRFASK